MSNRREFMVGSAAIVAAAAMPLVPAMAVPITIPVTDIRWDDVTALEYLSGARDLRCTVRRLDTGELFSWTVNRHDSRFKVTLHTYFAGAGPERSEIVLHDVQEKAARGQ